MTCAVLRSHPVIPRHDLSESQFLPSPPFLDINSTCFEMMTPSDRLLYKRILRQEYNKSEAFRSNVNTFLKFVDRLPSDKTCNPSHQAHSPRVIHKDTTGSLMVTRRPVEKSEDSSLIRRSRHHPVISPTKSVTHIPPPVPGRRSMLLPPRPRLSSPLTPHPNVPQDGPNLRRPFPKKRRRVEVPLLKRALFNCSNVERGLSQQSDDAVEDAATYQVCIDSITDLSSSWIYVPKPVDDWELVLKGDLY